MTKSNTRAAAVAATEYSVYTYRQSANDLSNDGRADWERKIITKNKLRAFAKARRLYASNDYERVEIKKKMLASASAYPMDATLKIYKKHQWKFKPSRSLMLLVGMVLGFIIAGGFAYVAYSFGL